MQISPGIFDSVNVGSVSSMMGHPRPFLSVGLGAGGSMTLMSSDDLRVAADRLRDLADALDQTSGSEIIDAVAVAAFRREISLGGSPI